MARPFFQSHDPMELAMSETSGVPVTPEAAPANYMLRWQRHEAAKREAAAQNRRIVFATLALHGITQVNVSFNGEGDSGQIEDITVTPEDLASILQREIAMKTTSWPDADVAQESGPSATRSKMSVTTPSHRRMAAGKIMMAHMAISF